MSINEIKPRADHNYVAFFLTLACNLKCSYCINLHNGGTRYARAGTKHLNVEKWIEAANRLTLREDLPLTLQGGEPTMYKGFYRFVNEVKREVKMDLLTNMTFDVKEFISNTPVWRFDREAPYAAIRASYHPEENDIDDLIEKTFRLQDAGFRIGIYGVLVPDEIQNRHILETQEKCLSLGIDFRVKEFLGEWQGRLYGTFKYEGSVNGRDMKGCECRTGELLVDPGGYIYRCHSDLYKGRSPISHISDNLFTEAELDQFRWCGSFGDCNPCDVKVKTNRYQVSGHTSVEIRNISPMEINADAAVSGETYGYL